MPKLKFPESKPLKIEDAVIYSTGLIGDHAKEGEGLSLFTTPRGQFMPQIPFDATRCRTCNQPAGRVLMDADTNICQAGQFGSAIGDAKLERVRAVLSGGDPVSLDAEVKLRVAGKLIIETTLAQLAKGWVQLEDEVPMVESRGPGRLTPAEPMKVPFVLVARTDTFEARVTLKREAKISGGPLVVRLEFEGKVAKDAVESYEGLSGLGLSGLITK